MEFREFLSKYLSSKKIWAVAVLSTVLGNLVVTPASLDWMRSLPGLPGLSAFLMFLGFLFFPGAVYFLVKSVGLDVDDEALSIGFTFAALMMLSPVLFAVRSVINLLMAQPTVFIWLSSILTPLSIFLLTTGAYTFFKGVETVEVEKALVSVLSGLVGFLGVSYLVGTGSMLSVLSSFFLEKAMLGSVVKAFFVVISASAFIGEGLDWGWEKPGFLVAGFGAASLSLTFVGNWLTVQMIPQFSEVFGGMDYWANPGFLLFLVGVSFLAYSRLREVYVGAWG